MRIWMVMAVGLGTLACLGPVATETHPPDGVVALDALEGSSTPVRTRRRPVQARGESFRSEGRALPVEDLPLTEPAPRAQGTAERTEVLLDRGVLERDLAEVERVSEVIGLRPNLTLRGIDGFRVTALPSGSPLAGIGLREGDVVHSVNGHELRSLESAMEAGAALQDAEVLEGVITRNGRERRLVVRLE